MDNLGGAIMLPPPSYKGRRKEKGSARGFESPHLLFGQIVADDSKNHPQGFLSVDLIPAAFLNAPNLPGQGYSAPG
ncbi:MAG: hypothetical protein HOH46_09925 [Rhodospirillaceae bacterium]|jgi:hypothetical protein|nr:hypothetical protein [Rhodospirillaceae bacterium]